MNKLAQLLSSEDILLDLNVSSKSHFFDAIARLFESRHGISHALAKDSLLAREAMGSTALGHGVAIPHARIAGLDTAMGALVRTRFALPFDAPDGKPVTTLLVLLVPEHANTAHLELLATAAGMFSDKALREQLKTATSVESVKTLLDEWSPPR